MVKYSGKYACYFWGGSSYAYPGSTLDLEWFDSLKAIRQELRDRYFDPKYPCLSVDGPNYAHFLVYKGYGKPGIDYPDFVIYLKVKYHKHSPHRPVVYTSTDRYL